jgi:S-DNA-T family DNA segregation ATPase FtsK/SpoIIIE
VAVLHDDPELPLVADTETAAADTLWLPVGPGGDGGAAVGVDVHRTGGLLVVGPPGSGRSAALEAFARHCASAGRAVVQLVDSPAPPPPRGQPHRLDRADVDALRTWLAGPGGQPPPVVVADDLTSLPDPVADLLGSLPSRGAVLLAAGTAAELAGSFRGPAVALRRSRTALLLRPAPGDAELLGLRTPRTPVPARPGAGWLVSGTDAVRVQVARRRTP